MSQRAFHAAALFTSNLLFRATSSHAFAPPPLLRPPSVFDGIPSQNRAAFHTSMRSTARQDQHDEARGGEWPRVLVVARRQTRKNKFVDFVGEYHISLLQESGACPILIPRTDGTLKQLEAYLYGGVDGLLVMEGADIGPQHNPYGPGRMLKLPALPPPTQLQTITDFAKGDVNWINPEVSHLSLPAAFASRGRAEWSTHASAPPPVWRHDVYYRETSSLITRTRAQRVD